MKLADLKGKTVGVCVSGGLDSKTICCVLKDAGVKVKAFSANVGQPPILACSRSISLTILGSISGIFPNSP